MQTEQDLLICQACGTQFDVPFDQPPQGCKICDDPRQYVPPTGQAWTSLSQLRSSGKYKNIFKPDDVDPRITSIYTEPKFAIGQRCFLLETPGGNVLFDCIAYLDEETVNFIKSKGGLASITISHPHYYSTHLEWAARFGCPVHIAKEDEEWVSRPDREGRRKLIQGGAEKILNGVTAIKIGGHFPGMLVLHWDNRLFIADALVTVPSALYFKDRQPGTSSFAFMWSIPNMIPLPPSELLKMWQAIRPFEFDTTHGAFLGLDVRDKHVKARVLESMKIQARTGTDAEQHHKLAILKETL